MIGKWLYCHCKYFSDRSLAYQNRFTFALVEELGVGEEGLLDLAER